MQIEIDHVPRSAADIERSVALYGGELGAAPDGLNKWRADKWPIGSISFGHHRFNLISATNDFTLKAGPAVGGCDYCFVSPGTPDSAIAHLRHHGVESIEGPVARNGRRGEGVSVHFRDHDGNLLQLISYPASSPQ